MSTSGVVVRFFGGLAAGVACVVLVVGWLAPRESAGATGVLAAGQRDGSWASPAELAWLGRAGRWGSALVGQTPDVIASRCANLRASVGAPPSARLRSAEALLERACAAFAHGSNQHDGAALFVQANDLLPPGETRALPVIAGAVEASRVEPRFGAAASDLAGKDVEVRCWSRADWPRLIAEEKAFTVGRIDEHAIGFAGVGGGRINLAPEICDGLVQLAYDGSRPTSPVALQFAAAAVATLTHEAQHTKGIAVEAQAECYAIQLMPKTAVELGTNPEYARLLQTAYWQRYPDELPAYRSAACADGRAYDLRPRDPLFP